MGRATAKVITKKADKVVTGDPVENRIKDLALRAVGVYCEILDNGTSERNRLSAADSVLDRAGYKPHTEKTSVSVEITEKMADRFERVLGQAVCTEKKTIITKEVG